MESDLPGDYEKLRKKFSLPEFGELDKEFDISEIDEYKSLLKSIREVMGDKVAKASEIILEIMQPEASISTLYESRVFNEKEKNLVFELFRKIMVIKRQSDKLYIINDEKMDAEFINNTLVEWKKMKPEIIAILSELEDCWRKDSEIADRLAYFG